MSSSKEPEFESRMPTSKINWYLKLTETYKTNVNGSFWTGILQVHGKIPITITDKNVDLIKEKKI